MSVYLKVKIKSLAAEAAIIRKEANRFQRRDNPTRLSLTAHRKDVVRPAARSAQIAYGFLRGMAFEEIERFSRTPFDKPSILRLVERYGVEGTGAVWDAQYATLSNWLFNAQEQIRRNAKAYHANDAARHARRMATRQRQAERRSGVIQAAE